jgi:hypothetical protein
MFSRKTSEAPVREAIPHRGVVGERSEQSPLIKGARGLLLRKLPKIFA